MVGRGVQHVSPSMIFRPSGTFHVLSVAGEAAWLNCSHCGQEFLANYNLFLVTGPHRSHQKIIEKKGDLTIDRSFFTNSGAVCV